MYNELCKVLPVLVDFLVALHVRDSGPERGVGAIMRVLEAVRVFRRTVPSKRSQKPLPSTLGSLRRRDDQFERGFRIQFAFSLALCSQVATGSRNMCSVQRLSTKL